MKKPGIEVVSQKKYLPYGEQYLLCNQRTKICKQCGMNPDTFELDKCKHEWVEGPFVMAYCRKCSINKHDIYEHE